jgi:protein SCO1/2
VSTRSWLGPVALGVVLACAVFAYLRPVLGQKRGLHPHPTVTGALAPRSLYRLDASFQDDEGRPFRLSALRGNFQVLALVFTRCPSVCPTLVHELSALERKMPSAVGDATRFTLVSIDPAHDTPAVLHAYRAKLDLSPDRFLLLRAEPDSVRELSALLGFSYSSAEDGMPLAHSKLVTVLNREGEIIHQQDSVSADSQKIIDAIARAL